MTKNEKLTAACNALYLEVHPSIADAFKELVKDVIEEAEQNQFYIDCLDSGGVDNWEWYSESLQEYWERYN